MNESMEAMVSAMAAYERPPAWVKFAWASRASLSVWVEDMLARHVQLLKWTVDLVPPKVVWISGFFQPQAFVTAVMQVRELCRSPCSRC
jgi:dynein heavy chain